MTDPSTPSPTPAAADVLTGAPTDLGDAPADPGDAPELTTLTGPEPADLAALHRRLEIAAAGGGLLDVAYRVLDSPVGALLLARTPRGLVRIAFAAQDHDAVLADLSARLSPRILHSPSALDDAAYQIDAYFAGRATDFELPLDRALTAGFRAEVQTLLPRIAYGATVSYARLAELAGNPKAVRAVGSACATNPLPIVLPCHRVLRSDGSLGGYAGGLDAKRALLALESRSGGAQ